MLTELAPQDALAAAESEPGGVLRLETGEFLTLLLMAATAALKTLFGHCRGQHDRQGQVGRVAGNGARSANRLAMDEVRLPAAVVPVPEPRGA